jgi:hypothetical protein
VPQHGNEHERSITDYWYCISSYIRGARSYSSINSNLGASFGRLARYIPTTASQTVTSYFIYNAAILCLLGVLAYKNSQHVVYRQYQSYHAFIHHDARPDMVDALWTLIFVMGQWGVLLSSLPIKAVNTTFMTISNLSPLKLPTTQYQTSLTLIFSLG